MSAVATKAVNQYVRFERGQLNTLSYRVYLRNSATNEFVSPFHDVPLMQAPDVFNMVVEIPRWTNAKMEVSKTELMNPIVQDVKKGKLRFVNNIFPYKGYPWNYGAMPQTWEDPNVIEKITGCKGDNDPLDICEIGSVVHERGAVIGVKVLGAIGLIDEGEADWKLIAIDVNDPMSAKLNDIGDVEAHMPGLLTSTIDWFRIYKVPTGKPANQFAENGKIYDRAFAMMTIEHDHHSWQKLIKGGYDAEPEKKMGCSLWNTSLDVSHNTVSNEEVAKKLETETAVYNAQPAFIDMTPIDEVHFVNRDAL